MPSRSFSAATARRLPRARAIWLPRASAFWLLFASALGGVASLAAQANAQAPFVPSQAAPAPLGGARVTGQVTGLTTTNFQLALRGGRTIAVHLRTAQAAHLVPPAVWLGEYVSVQGKRTGAGAITALAVTRAKSAPALWPADSP